MSVYHSLLPNHGCSFLLATTVTTPTTIVYVSLQFLKDGNVSFPILREYAYYKRFVEEAALHIFYFLKKQNLNGYLLCLL